MSKKKAALRDKITAKTPNKVSKKNNVSTSKSKVKTLNNKKQSKHVNNYKKSTKSVVVNQKKEINNKKNNKLKSNVENKKDKEKVLKNSKTTQPNEELNKQTNKQINIKKVQEFNKSNKTLKNIEIITKENKQNNKKKNNVKNLKRVSDKEKKTQIKKKFYILLFLGVLILIVLLFFAIYKTPDRILFKFKSYKIGDEIKLKDDSLWYSIEDSGIENSDITLLSASVLDLNKDKKIDKNDMISFDSDNQTEYNQKKDSNIAYFLKTKGKELLDNDQIKEIRLLTSEEYINIRKAMDFGYDWAEGNWLASEKIGLWWLKTSKYNKIYVVNNHGSYKLAEANSKNYVRVVIKINKSNIKTNTTE